MVSLFRNTMVVYHGFPVSKHHGSLPWFPCFQTPWYFTMVYLFRNTMVVYHGLSTQAHAHAHAHALAHAHTHTHTHTRTHADTHACTHNYTIQIHAGTNASTHARARFSPMHVVKANSRSGLFVSSRFTPAAMIVVCLSNWNDTKP